ncbi:MAG: hypothetical protein COA58_16800 [Bacteroidetes bacterium]|nr:MAG: hypothetical protein COA58_16800 [Bacteroidota bacterium]
MKVILLFFYFFVPSLLVGQTFPFTTSGTIINGSALTGWTQIATPDYSSTTVNGYHAGTPWSTTLPNAPGGSSTFPVVRSANIQEGISTTATGLTSGVTYTISINYMYPLATGTYGSRFNKPPGACAYVSFDGGANQNFSIYGSSSSTSMVYSNVQCNCY